MQYMKPKIMPALFAGHGSPMNALESNEFTRGWKEVAEDMPRPAAILSISAHWETYGLRVTAMEKPPTIHDFGGFPCELYEVQYPAPGTQFLVREIQKLTGALPDHEWGLDHGTWSVLIHMYPQADIPVVQLSLNYNQPARYHYELAQKLIPLRNMGVLILGSGNIVHNLRKVDWDHPESGHEWAIKADAKIKDLISKEDIESLIQFEKLGPEVLTGIPTPEHFLPLLYVLGTLEKGEPVSFFNEKVVMGSLSMTGVRTN